MSTIIHGPESRVRGAKNLPRNQLRIATLNVRTLTQAGSLEALKMDLARYKLDILGVQETRLQEQEIDLGDHKLYLSDSWLSGVKSRQGGVGVAVKKSLINSIVEQVALSERICYVKFAAQRRANLAVVVCYAPTNEASLQEKDLFWSQLSDLVSSFKHRERICVIGDLNAEPGHQLNDTMSCRGPFGMGEENENSEKLLSFCTSHKLLVGGKWFQHRQVHRYTFNPPDPSCRKKMLDHILFAERYRGCLTNVRSRRGKTTNSYDGFKCRVKAEGEKGRLFDVRTGVRQGDVWSPILFGLVINYILANSVHGGLDIGRLVADLDFADDVALVGVSDSEVQENLHRIEALAEAAGLKINVAKTKNMGVKCDSPNVVAVPSIQQNVEILTGTHKGKLGLLAETSSQSRLTIGTEVLLGTKKKAGWFETQDGRKLRLKSLAEAKPALVASQQQSAVADLESLENESGSAVADQESLRCQNCQRQFSTVTGRKVHQTRFCKAGLSKNVVDKSKFEQLEASLTCDKCERKFKTVNGRKVHQSRYCGKPKAAATRVFSCKVQDVIGNEFENIEAFKYLGSYVSLKHGDLQEVNCKLAEGRQRFANFQNLWKSKQLSVHLKCNLYKALVLSAVLYSSETWTLSKLMERKLESFHCGCLRRILRVSYLEKATNDEIMSRSRMPQLSTMIMLKRIKWYGHIQRMEPGRLARSAFDWDPPDQYAHARRAPGGQRKTWMSQIEGDCVRNKVSFTRLQEKAATGSKNAFNNFVVQHFTE